MIGKNMLDDIEKVLIPEDELKNIVTDLGKRISEDYKGKDLLVVGILKGSVVFMADLMRAITIPCNIDFMAVSSYGVDTESSGVVKIIKDLDDVIDGRNILIVEDILDTGLSLKYIVEILKTKNANSVKICTFLDKPDNRKADITADYVGAVVPNAFVVGYGLDYNEKYRNLPYLGVLKPEIYSK